MYNFKTIKYMLMNVPPVKYYHTQTPPVRPFLITAR